LKILLLKPSSLGDVVQALPVLRLLKKHLPASEIHWWLATELVPLLQDDPDLAGLFHFERRRWSVPWRWPELLASVRRIRSLRFDWVIDLQGLARSGAFAWLANGGYTIGVADPREGASGFYDEAVPRPSYYTHAVDWYLEVLRRLDIPVHQNFEWLPPRPAAVETVRRRIDPGDQIVLLQPGARWNNKRWPIEHFAAVVRQLGAEFPAARFVILGGGDDILLGDALYSIVPQRCLDLTARTTLPEMVEWVRASDFVITNDTGPMHVAAALRKPMAALFGPTEPRRTGPYGMPESVLRIDLPCAPCMKGRCSWREPMECLHALTPEMVLARARKVLGAPRRVANP
jgi:heptosyltransferase I